MKTGKTPYEIRLDLLRLAYDIVAGQKNIDIEEDPTSIVRPKAAPTTEEIVAEANKLNRFVSQSAEK